jgi:HEAT repeat protein
MDIKEFVNDLSNKDKSVRLYALKGVGSLGSNSYEAIPVLLRLIRTENDTEMKWRAVAALGVVALSSDEGIIALIRTFAERSRMVFSTAILVLERIGARAVPLLIDALQHDNYFIRSGAAGTLARIESSNIHEAVPALLDCLLNDQKMSVRASAAFALGSIHPSSQEIEKGLIKASGDSEWRVRDLAVSAIGKAGLASDAVIAAMIERLNDEEDLVRYSAISTLDQIRPPSDILLEPLRKALKDEDVVIRASAASLLGKLQPPPSEAVPDLETLLDDPAEEVQEAALDALQSITGDK